MFPVPYISCCISLAVFVLLFSLPIFLLLVFSCWCLLLYFSCCVFLAVFFLLNFSCYISLLYFSCCIWLISRAVFLVQYSSSYISLHVYLLLCLLCSFLFNSFVFYFFCFFAWEVDTSHDCFHWNCGNLKIMIWLRSFHLYSVDFHLYFSFHFAYFSLFYVFLIHVLILTGCFAGEMITNNTWRSGPYHHLAILPHPR